MKFKQYSHQYGDQFVPKDISDQVEETLKSVETPLVRRSAPAVRRAILGHLRDSGGWSGEVRISSRRGLTLTAKKGQTALCLQTGNMARFYADLLKLQAQFLEGKIKSAIYILPTHHAASAMGDNMVNYERLTAELANTFSRVITLPLMIYGFYSE